MSRLDLLSPEDLLAAARRVAAGYQAEGWTGRDGEEIYSALATTLSAVLTRIVCRSEKRYLETATGATPSAGSVRVTWTTGTTLAVGLEVGQVVAKTPWGVTYRLLEVLTAGAGESAGYNVEVLVESSFGQCEANVWLATHVKEWALPSGPSAPDVIGWSTTTTDAGKSEFLAGVDAGTITIVGEDTFSGGADATLDLIAMGRGLPRAEGESDTALRARIRGLPQVVTPVAIMVAVEEAIAWFGGTATMVEPWNYAWTVGDDPLGTIGDGGLSPVDHRPAFVVLVDGVPYDDEAWTVGDDPLGTIGDEYPIGIGHPYHDGIMAGLQELIDRIRAGGVDGRVAETP